MVMTEIPVIDFGEMDLAVSRKMHKAFTTVGLLYLLMCMIDG